MGKFHFQKPLDRSYIENLNFLYQHESIYLMDNHRVALWATLKEIDLSQRYNYLHIDAHYDAAITKDEVVPSLEDIKNLSLEAFLNAKSNLGNYALYRWDNYIPLLFKEDHFRRKVCLTHGIGQNISFKEEYGPWELNRVLDRLIVDELPWIINLDLDYFYAREFKDSPLIHQKAIYDFFKKLQSYYLSKDILCITVALSPECCGGWDKSFAILELFKQAFHLDFKLV